MALMGTMQNSITFGGINSAMYDLYIGGEGVWNAPVRAVEVVEVPGRNGAITIDQGHYENITVTYTVINHEKNMSDFLRKIDGFRNAICSQRGYRRLSDSFHPNEYRMAMFVDGMEVKPIDYAMATEFEIKFNCKPQRFLSTGEAKISVTSGDEIYNPTPYDAQPMIEVTGYGAINIGDKTIVANSEPLGVVKIADDGGGTTSDDSLVTLAVIQLNGDLYNVGDAITIGEVYIGARFVANSGKTITAMGSGSDAEVVYTSSFGVAIQNSAGVSFTAGTSSQDYVSMSGTMTDNTSTTDSYGCQPLFIYDATDETITVKTTVDVPSFCTLDRVQVTAKNITANSSVSILGTPLYIDCEMGECYKIESGSLVDLNRYIDLGSDLPKLAPGINEITFDNTVTKLEIVPRWWQL